MAATVQGWIDYAALRGVTVDDDGDSAQALQRATDYILYSYVSQFMSPYTVDSPYVDEATYEAANLELATVGFFTKTFTEAQQKVLTEVKGIKWTATASTSSRTAAQKSTPTSTLIDSMLQNYMPSYEAGAFLMTVGGYSE